MVQEQRKQISVDGGELDLQADWARQTGSGLLGFLTQHAPRNPWFVGIAAIVGIVVFGEPRHSPRVLGSAILGVTLITIVSTRKRSEYERERTPKSRRVSEDTIED